MIGVVEMNNDVKATVVGEVANAPVVCFFVVGIIVTLLDSVKGVVLAPLLVGVGGDNVVVVVGIGSGNIVVVFVLGSGGDVAVSGVLFVVFGISGGNVDDVVGSFVVVVVGGVLFVFVGVLIAVVDFVDDVVVGVLLLIVVFFVVLVVVCGFVLKVVVRGDAIKFVMTWFNSQKKIICWFFKARIMD